jgi:Amt family ammonium transporter
MHDLISFPLPLAAAKSGIDSGDTAWMMVATALVLMMTPALGLFYSGLVRSKNALNTFMMSLGAMAVVSITWVVIGYSLAFGKGDGFIGDLHNVFLKNVTNGPRAGLHIPELVFVCFEGAFCIITAALISGAVVERMRFGAFLLFAALWSCLIYAPMAHWVWSSNGWLGVYALLGASLLWFGWFGFNAGSALTTGAQAPLAFTNTLLAPAATLSIWMLIDYLRGRKATAIGAATAIVVGAVGITPAAGFVSPMSAILLGALAALPAYALIVWRPRTRLDETLDVLAAHGLAGFTGILFIGFFAQASWNLTGNGLLFGSPIQLGRQAVAALVAPAYAFCGTFVLLKLMSLVGRIRVHERDEGQGLDVSQHGEEAYTRGEGAILIRPEHVFELERKEIAKSNFPENN